MNPRIIDLTGQTFGRWTVIGPGRKSDPPVTDGGSESYPGQAWWLCECSCARKTRRSIASANLRAGRSGSCGCLRSELARERNTRSNPNPYFPSSSKKAVARRHHAG